MEERKPVAIVMTVYNAGKCLKLAIDSLLNSTNYPLKLIIIESGSDDGTSEMCDEYAKKDERIKVIHNKDREGVTKAVNIGIKEAGDLDVLLTQADVIFPKKYISDWLYEMVTVSKAIKNCGAVTCFGGGGISGPDYLDGFRWVGTWCVFIPRKTINKIGLFDENFIGPGDDIDYSYRIYLAGLSIFTINYWVDHHRILEHHTEKDKVGDVVIADIQKKNGEFFRKKWGLK